MGSSNVTVGHRYYVGVEATICLGPVDAVTRLRSEKREAWSGEVTSNQSVDIHKPDLFGGDDGQGGLSGIMEVRMGGETQEANEYMQGLIGEEIPATIGLLTLIFRGRTEAEAQANSTALIFGEKPIYGNIFDTDAWRNWIRSAFYWTAINPYIKPVAPTVRRILSGWTTPVFYPATARIGTKDMNPVHIIYQCFTDLKFGMKRSTSMIQDASWKAAADALVSEEFGLSLKWARQGSVEDFVQEVLRHIDAAIDTDMTTGQYVLKLIRDDYEIEDLLQLNPTNIVRMEKFERVLWGETVNQITVMYTDPETEELVPVVVNDLANQRIQRAIVPETIPYPGVRSPALAYRLGERDLRARSTPLRAMELTTNLVAWNVKKGDVIRVTWPGEKLSDFLVRVLDVDRGEMEKGEIHISGVEDVFAIASNSYGIGQGSLWTNPAGTPTTISTARLVELPYAQIVREFSDADRAALVPEQSFTVALAEKPSPINQKVNVYASPNSTLTNFIRWQTGKYTTTAKINGALDRQQTNITYDSVVGGSLAFFKGAYGLLDDEWVEISDVNTATAQITLRRGLFHSVPAAHADDARLWFYAGEYGVEMLSSDWVEGETVYYRETGSSLANETALASAPQQIHQHKATWSKPYPPANVRIDGEYFPSAVIAGFTITWAGRDRVSQADARVDWYAAGIQPSEGITYALRVYNASTNGLLGSVDGLTCSSGTGTHTYAGATATNMRIELYAVEDGEISVQRFSHTAALAP